MRCEIINGTLILKIVFNGGLCYQVYIGIFFFTRENLPGGKSVQSTHAEYVSLVHMAEV